MRLKRYVLNVAGVPIDVRRYPLFASFVYLAELLNRAYEGRYPIENWYDAVEQFSGFSTRAAIGNSFIESIEIMMRGASGKDDRWTEREAQLGKHLVGRVAVSPLRPL